MPVGGSVPSQLPTAAQAAAAYAEPPAKRLKAADLPGTVRGMTTYGLGRDRQLQWDLKHKACCTCQAKGKAAKHAGSCEHRYYAHAHTTGTLHAHYIYMQAAASTASSWLPRNRTVSTPPARRSAENARAVR